MKIKYFFPLIASALLLAGCDDVISPAIENFKDIDQMQKEPDFAQGFLVTAYRNLPGYYDNSEVATDDAVTNSKSDVLLKMATGSWTADNNPMNRWSADYASIQYLNIFLQNVSPSIHFVKNDDVNQLLVTRMKGEAYGLRAIHHYYLLRNHSGFTADGKLMGVQLLTSFQDVNADFNQARSSFADCVAQIDSDLVKAETLLPEDYNDVTSTEEIPEKYRQFTTDPDQYNRAMGKVSRQLINARIVRCFRSRLFLLAASPAFQSADNTITWADAADAAARVIDVVGGPSGLSATGETYYTNDDEISELKEGTNPSEIIWRENLASNASDQEASNYPPSLFGKGYINPTQNLVDAFPMANGYPISDSRSGYDKDNPYEGRDSRLAKYIIYNGAEEGPSDKTILTGSKLGTDDGINVKETSTRTGYYMKKRLNMKVNCDPTSKTGVTRYIPRLRYTEFFLNYAEAANEAWGPEEKGSHSYSAYDVIKAIRQRAGIGLDGDDYLEECATSKDKMRELIRNERRIELSFESFRFWDLRRWKANLNETARGIDWGTEGYTDLDNVEKRSYQDYMNYGPIPYSEILKYSNLEQNSGWQ